jgi:hypothetical protein
MMRTGWLQGLVALSALTVTLSASAAPSPDDKSSLNQVPANAPLVVYVHGVERTKDRVVTLLKNALPDLAPMIQGHIDEGFKRALEGRSLKGLAKEGPLFVVFTDLPHPGTEPKVAVIAAVTSYAEFRDNVLKEQERKSLKKEGGIESTTMENGETLYLIDRKGFVVATPNKEVAADLAKNPAGLAGKVSSELATKLLESDVGLFVNMDPINKQYAEQIKHAREQAEEGFKALEGQLSQLGKSQQAMVEILRKAIKPVFQAVEDSSGILVTLEARPQAVALHAQMEVREDSTTAKVLKEAKPSAFSDMGRLPAGRLVYTGMHTSKMMYDILGPLMFGAMPEPDAKEAKELKAGIDELIQAGPGDRLDATSVPPAGLSIWKFNDPVKAVEGQIKLLQATGAGGTLQSGMLKEKPAIKPKAQKYGAIEFTSVHLVWDLEKMMEAGGAALPEEMKKQMANAMKQLMGQDMNFWIGTDGKVFVQVIAQDWPAAEKILDQYFKGQNTVGAQAAFRDARKEMPAQGTLIALFDVLQYADVMVNFVKSMLAGLAPIPNFPAPAKDKPNYGGVAFTLQPRGGSVDLMVTATAINGIYTTYVKPLMNRAGAGAGIQ